MLSDLHPSSQSEGICCRVTRSDAPFRVSEGIRCRVTRSDAPSEKGSGYFGVKSATTSARRRVNYPMPR
eukprot:1185571-Prorocentrum_minimum.AAC.1